LVLVIIVLQCLYFFLNTSVPEYQVNSKELKKYEQEIDSLRNIELEKKKPKKQISHIFIIFEIPKQLNS